MSRYQEFIFKNYSYNPSTRTLDLDYSYDNELNYRESYHFDFDPVEYSDDALDRACQILFFIAGVSYFKAYLAPKIKIEKGSIDKKLASFLDHTYQKGLRELFYNNKLDIDYPIIFPSNVDKLEKISGENNSGLLIGIGGGKDSLVTVELLKAKDLDLSTWSLGHRSQLTPLVKEIGLKHYWVERKLDPKLLDPETRGDFNGHIPVSAIFACVGTVLAVLSGRQDVVVSCEQSANEPSLIYKGLEINHQYSKSEEFERDYQEILKHTLGNSSRYYSFLRPLSELYIAEIFSHVGFEKYKPVFSSCNRAFVQSSDHLFWCGKCPKCAFIFLVLTPFIDRVELEEIWGGKNLLLDNSLEQTYKQLLGIEGDKPLDCVGEVKESRTAMRLAQKTYPELKKYKFEIPSGYDYRELGTNSMPQTIFRILVDSLATLW